MSIFDAQKAQFTLFVLSVSFIKVKNDKSGNIVKIFQVEHHRIAIENVAFVSFLNENENIFIVSVSSHLLLPKAFGC